MNLENEQSVEEEVADHLWRAITMLQAMTGRLLTQHGRTASGQNSDAHRLAGLAPV